MITYHVDLISLRGAAGWAFSDSGRPVQVEAWCNGKCIGSSLSDRPRPDVVAVHAAAGPRSGFAVGFEHLPGPEPEVEIAIHLSDGVGPTVGAAAVRLLTDSGYQAVGQACNSAAAEQTCFPRHFQEMVRSVWPAATEPSAVADKIMMLATTPYREELAAIVNYVRFLNQTWSHFQFVRRHFPSTNRDRSPTDKDYCNTPNSPEELMSIANHLYVLKSYGASGVFAEFGCFKGYSTAMLSYACSLLGLRMHVFDSFSGLPQSSSHGYASGDFAGSLDEVQKHVGMFGAPEAVTYHKGYFSDTLPGFNEPELISLWMDVDLESSAKDVMRIAGRVHPLGAVFSHECEPQFFPDIRSVEPNPDRVVPAICDAYERLGERMEGRFMSGCTGAFWRCGRGIPVTPNDILLRMVAAA